MPRKPPGPRTPRCQVCAHPERGRIEAAKAAGAGFSAVAEKFGVDRFALTRHWNNHVSAEAKTAYLAGPATIQALRERAIEEDASTLDYLRILRSTLVGQLVICAETGDAGRVAYLGSKVLEVLQEIGKLTGEIRRLNPGITITNTVVTLFETPGFVAFADGLLRVARDHPEAKADILALLRQMEAGPAPEPPTIEGTVHAA
ncbi:hypothetical protein FF100_33550 [Methylobacterium terricola]|uniref:Phage regulatory protein CII (CP76) n=1 Tax=Methylobacterium terricola TaxID=2583531 RepID=A0A5C4L8D6_9HYPH|nr:hypothetical protein [Methylobacterium terricola]TNC07101.1 hypothetical protein FF100_33550 [Methylobacterium terricola]